MKTKIFYGMVAVLVLLPYFAFADSREINSSVWDPSILAGPLVTCTGTGSGDIPACQNLCDLVSTSANVVYFGMGVVIWIIIPIMFAWGGMLLMFSQGNPGKTSEARKMLFGTLIGLLIVICAYLLVLTFVNVMGITGIGGFGTESCPLQS